MVLLRRFGFISGAVIFVLWIGLWLWLSGAFVKSAQWGRDKFYDTTAQAGFRVENVLVEGRIHTDPEIIRALMNVQKGDPILTVRPGEAKELIERIRWVKEAHVERRLPGTIYIGLLERKPLALWHHEKKLRLIDTEGAVITDQNLGGFKELIMLTGPDAPDHAADLFAFLDAEPQIKERVEAAKRVGARRWDLVTTQGIAVRLPEDDIGHALSRLKALQNSDNLLDKELTVIDLRVPDRVIVRTKPGGVEEYRASVKGSAI